MITSHDPVTIARDALGTYNAKRYDPVQRDLFWNAEHWEALLQALVAAETARDEALQRQIADRSLTSAYLRSYEEQLFTQLQQDEHWYATEAAALTQFATPASPTTPVTSHAYELVWHILLLEQRSTDRRVRLAEIGLEIMERRRRAQGLTRDVWTSGWQRLSAAWHEQDTWHEALCDGVGRPELGVERIPDTWCKEANAERETRLDGRLAWLHQLQSYQEASRQAAKQAGLNTRDLDADMVVVAQAIGRLEPPPALSGTTGGGAAIVLSVVAVIALVLVISGVIRSGSGVTATPTATPSSLSGTTTQVTMAANDPAILPGADVKAIARGFLDAGQCNDAVVTYEKAIQATPDDYELYNDVAFCLYDLGRVDEAVMRWNEALQRNPNSPDARAGLAMALFTHGHTEEALDNYAQALALEPGYADPTFLREQRSWSEQALTASQPLRDALIAP